MRCRRWIVSASLINTLLYTIADIERMADHATAVANAAPEHAVMDLVDHTAAACTSFGLERAITIEPLGHTGLFQMIGAPYLSEIRKRNKISDRQIPATCI